MFNVHRPPIEKGGGANDRLKFFSLSSARRLSCLLQIGQTRADLCRTVFELACNAIQGQARQARQALPSRGRHWNGAAAATTAARL